MNPALAPWAWAIAAVVLAGLELHAPGAFFLWLAGAAAATSLLAFALDPAWQWQVVHFVLLGIIAVLLGRQFFGHRIKILPASGLNRRADRMIGARVTVVEAIAGGEGRVQVGDSPWLATGPDMAAGTSARVVRVEGTMLVVVQA